MIQDIFKDINLQTKFNDQGFLVINFLNESEILKLTTLFDTLNKDNNNSGMVIGSLIDDLDYKKHVEDSINDILKEKIKQFFINYEIFNSSFVYKSPRTLYDFPPHQDNSMVDETKHLSVNLWIPLTDITIDNGPVFVVPGTQFSKYPSYRGPNIKYFYLNNPEVVYKYGVPLLLKKGEVAVLNHSVIHYSYPNFTNETRKAIVVALKTIFSPNLLFFYNKVYLKIQVMEMNSDLKYSYEKYHFDRNEIPNGKIISEFSFNNLILQENELNSVLYDLVIASNAIKSNISIFKFKNSIRRKIIEFKCKILN